MELSEKIREIRKLLGLSQQEFARLLGVKQNTISDYECGHIAMRYTSLLKLKQIIHEKNIPIDLL